MPARGAPSARRRVAVVAAAIGALPSFAHAQITFLNSFGASASSNPQFNFTSIGGVAVSPTGLVYVADTGASAVDAFNPSGTFQSTIGSAGTGPGQYTSPASVAVDSAGSVYVVDGGNAQIDVYNSAGTFQSSFGSFGSGNGQFLDPEAAAVSFTGSVYVTDDANNNVQVFNSSG